MEDLVAVSFLIFSAITFIACLVAVAAVVNGWALLMLWQWFVIPVFGLPALSIPEAIGLGLIFTLLTYHPSQSSRDKDNKSTNTSRFLDAIMRPVFSVLEES